MNRDNAIDPIDYLNMVFGRFVNDSQDIQFRRINYMAFSEMVLAFTACGVFKDVDQYHKAREMEQSLKKILDV